MAFKIIARALIVGASAIAGRRLQEKAVAEAALARKKAKRYALFPPCQSREARGMTHPIGSKHLPQYFSHQKCESRQAKQRVHTPT